MATEAQREARRKFAERFGYRNAPERVNVRRSRRARAHSRRKPTLAQRSVADYMKWMAGEEAYWTQARKDKWYRDNPEGETPPWMA